jgi:hypothetical protein
MGTAGTDRASSTLNKASLIGVRNRELRRTVWLKAYGWSRRGRNRMLVAVVDLPGVLVCWRGARSPLHIHCRPKSIISPL